MLKILVQIFSIVFAIFFVGGVVISIPTLWKIIRIWRTPTTWIRALPDAGAVEVTGKAITRSPLISPFYNIPCAVWAVEIQEKIPGQNGTEWKTVYKKTSNEPFELDDGTGVIQICPAGAELVLTDPILEYFSRRDLEKNQDFRLSRQKIKDLYDMMEKPAGFSLNELAIPPEKEIYVHGTIQTSGGRRYIGASSVANLIISDHQEGTVLLTLYEKLGKIWLSVGLGFVCLVLVLAFQG